MPAYRQKINQPIIQTCDSSADVSFRYFRDYNIASKQDLLVKSYGQAHLIVNQKQLNIW